MEAEMTDTTKLTGEKMESAQNILSEALLQITLKVGLSNTELFIALMFTAGVTAAAIKVPIDDQSTFTVFRDGYRAISKILNEDQDAT